jgi:hypothetical protein
MRALQAYETVQLDFAESFVDFVNVLDEGMSVNEYVQSTEENDYFGECTTVQMTECSQSGRGLGFRLELASNWHTLY